MEYCVARTIEEAFGLLATKSRPKPVAGGTDLAVVLADALVAVDTLVDVAAIPSLKGIRVTPRGVAIGAATGIAEIARNDALPSCLAQGARSIGSPQIRNLATIGGNICNASPCGDTLAPLIALDAVFVLATSAGMREVPAETFFTGPKKTVIRPDELLVEIRVDAAHARGASAFRMIGKRNGQVISQVNVAVWMDVVSGAVRDARAAIGSVAPVPLRLSRTETLLKGRRAADIDVDAAIAAMEAEIAPISDVRATLEYRRLVSGALFRECIDECRRVR
ncbi:MAG TPA: xanthine dehydrogenase family protein subunit M [Spirochaetia bacterium]